MDLKTCSCGDMEQRGLPCRHVLAVKHKMPEARLVPLQSLCHPAYTVSAMENTWAYTCEVPELTNLVTDMTVLLPPLRDFGKAVTERRAAAAARASRRDVWEWADVSAEVEEGHGDRAMGTAEHTAMLREEGGGENRGEAGGFGGGGGGGGAPVSHLQAVGRRFLEQLQNSRRAGQGSAATFYREPDYMMEQVQFHMEVQQQERDSLSNQGGGGSTVDSGSEGSDDGPSGDEAQLAGTDEGSDNSSAWRHVDISSGTSRRGRKSQGFLGRKPGRPKQKRAKQAGNTHPYGREFSSQG